MALVFYAIYAARKRHCNTEILQADMEHDTFSFGSLIFFHRSEKIRMKVEAFFPQPARTADLIILDFFLLQVHEKWLITMDTWIFFCVCSFIFSFEEFLARLIIIVVHLIIYFLNGM